MNWFFRKKPSRLTTPALHIDNPLQAIEDLRQHIEKDRIYIEQELERNNTRDLKLLQLIKDLNVQNQINTKILMPNHKLFLGEASHLSAYSNHLRHIQAEIGRVLSTHIYHQQPSGLGLNQRSTANLAPNLNMGDVRQIIKHGYSSEAFDHHIGIEEQLPPRVKPVSLLNAQVAAATVEEPFVDNVIPYARHSAAAAARFSNPSRRPPPPASSYGH